MLTSAAAFPALKNIPANKRGVKWRLLQRGKCAADQGRLFGFIPEMHSVYRTAGLGPVTGRTGLKSAAVARVARRQKVATVGVAHHAHVLIHMGRRRVIRTQESRPNQS